LPRQAVQTKEISKSIRTAFCAVPMIENYNIDLQAHAVAVAAGGSYDQQLRQWPMQYEPLMNCPWAESSWENAASPFTPKLLRSLTYTGLVCGTCLF